MNKTIVSVVLGLISSFACVSARAESVVVPAGETKVYSAAAGETLTVADEISGEGAVAVEGEGTVWFTKSNTYTGGFTVKSGTAKGGAGAFGPTYTEEGSVITIEEGATLEATSVNQFGYRLKLGGTFSNLGGVSWNAQIVSITVIGDKARVEGGATGIHSKVEKGASIDFAGHTLTVNNAGEGFQFHTDVVNVTDPEVGGRLVVEGGAFQVYGYSNVRFEGIDLILKPGAKVQGFSDLIVRDLTIGEGSGFSPGRSGYRTWVSGRYTLGATNGSLPEYLGFYSTTTFGLPKDLKPGETLTLARSGGIAYKDGAPKTEKVDFYLGEELIEGGNLTLDASKRTIAYELPKGGKIFWSGAAGDGLWETAENWTSGVVPTDEDEVCFTIAADVTVTGASQAGSLRISAPVTMTLAGKPELVEIEVAADGELALAASEGETQTIGWSISGEGKVAVAGEGTIAFTTTGKTYTGGFTVKSGTASGQYGSFGSAESVVTIEDGATLELASVRNFLNPIHSAGTIRHLGGVIWSDPQIVSLTLTGDTTLEGGPIAIYNTTEPGKIDFAGHTLTTKLSADGFQFYNTTVNASEEKGGRLVVAEGTTFKMYGNGTLHFETVDLIVEDGASATGFSDVHVRDLSVGSGSTFTCGVWSRAYVRGELAFKTKNGSVPQYITLYPTTTFRFPVDLAPEETMTIAMSGNINLENGGPKTTAVDFYVGEEAVERGTILMDASARTIAFKYPNAAVWVGTHSSDWNDPANWKPAVVPNGETIVTIEGKAEIKVGSDSQAGEVILAEGAELTLSAPAETEVTVGMLFSGAGALAVGGAGTIQLTNANNCFAGGFTAKSGTAKGKKGVFGVPRSTVTVEAGATVEFSNANGSLYNIKTAGTIRHVSAGQWESHFIGLTLTGDARLEGSYFSFTNADGMPIDLGGHTLTVALNEGKDLQLNRAREANESGGRIHVVSGGIALYGSALHLEHGEIYLGEGCTLAAGDVDAFIGRLGVTGNGRIKCNNHRFTFSEPIDAAKGTMEFAKNTYITSTWTDPKTGAKNVLAFDLGDGTRSGKTPYARVVANPNSNLPGEMAKSVVFDQKNNNLVLKTQINEAGATEYFATRNGFSIIVR